MTLFYLCLAWLAGVGLAPVLGLPFGAALAAGVFLFLFALTVRKFRIGFLAAAFFLLGCARLAAAQPAPGPGFVGTYIGRAAEFEIELEDDPLPKGEGLRVRARVVRIGSGSAAVSDVAGSILVEFRTRPAEWNPQYGDRAVLSGTLLPPPEFSGFDYAGYLARQGVFGLLKDPAVRSDSSGSPDPARAALFSFRRRALEVLRALFPEPESALLAGILLGDESAIPLPVQEAFARTGTSHIVAISGFNISIIAGLFLALTKRLPRRVPGWLLAAAGIALYTVLVGAAASVVRSAIMGGMVVVGRQTGRASHGLTSLLFAGAAMTAANPWTLWDIGFQLSFAATLGLILYADPLQAAAARFLEARIARERARGLAALASDIFLMTLAAQVTTLPLLLFYFNSFSLSAFLVNPLILSVQPMVMIAGGLAMLLGMVWLPAGRMLAWAGWVPTAYTIRTVEWGAGMTRLWWPIGIIPPVWIIAYYAWLLTGTVLAARGKLPKFEWAKSLAGKISAAALPALAAAAFLAWAFYFREPDGRLQLTVLDGGGGEALLLRTPAGGTVLINAGGDANLAVAGLGRRLGFGPQRLDWIVVGSPSWDRTSALVEIASRNDVGAVLLPEGADRGGKTLSGFLAVCDEKKIPVFEGSGGYVLDLGAGARLRILERSDDGLLFMVEFGSARWLILDGLGDDLNRRMLSQGRIPSAQIIVFPLSIKETGGLTEWVRAVRPTAGLWPFAEDLGWPAGVELLRVDSRGWIELSTDGSHLWVRSER
jgi:competence protein ComEC